MHSKDLAEQILDKLLEALEECHAERSAKLLAENAELKRELEQARRRADALEIQLNDLDRCEVARW